jgi:hypothetical protein
VATLRRGFLLAGWANTEELETMRNRFEFALGRDPLLQFPHHAITNLHHAGTTRANQMMLVSVSPLVN